MRTNTNTKYGNKRVSEDGYDFDSLAELARWRELRLLSLAGDIFRLIVHPKYELIPPYIDRETGRRERAIFYVADFEYQAQEPDGFCRTVVEDVKGFETAVWRLKRRMFLAKYRWPSYELRIIR